MIFYIHEVMTNQDLGIVQASSKSRAYAMALADQRGEVMCRKSPHGIKLLEIGKADSWLESEENIIWF